MNKHFRVATVGAGPGGISTAHALIEAGIDDFVMFEKAPSVGGTWHHNRYPGAECDVMSHLYSFSFAPNPRWSQRYARQPEILAYVEKVVEDLGLGERLRLSEGVDALCWDEERHRWLVTTEKGEYSADMVVSAVGMFNTPVLPDIPGLDQFGGRVIHTAQWPEGDMLEGLKVAVIGSAASAIQLIPEIAVTAKHLTVFQRTPVWVMPKDDRPYTDDDIREFCDNPGAVKALRAEIEERVDRTVLFDDPEICAKAMAGAHENISVVRDPETRRKLTPSLPYGSRRPIVSNYYYPTFNRGDVELITERIERVEKEGLRTADGNLHEVDVIVCATGFIVSRYASIIDISGKNGRKLSEEWSEDPSAYLGVMVPGFPNLVMMYGPNTNNGSILTMLESQAEFAVGRLKWMEREGITSFEVRSDVTRAYNDALQQELDAIEVWQAQPDGYYRGRSGRIVTQWPNTMAEYHRRLRDVEPESFEIAKSSRPREVA